MSTAPRARVTVLTAVYNGEQFLRDAIESTLRQSFTAFELVIVNDGSTDGTQRVLESYDDARIRILVNARNLGVAAALNRGLEHARGELVAQLDADDVSHPMRLQRQVAFLDAHPQIALVGTQVRRWPLGGRPQRSCLLWRPSSDEVIRFQTLLCNPFIHSSVMYRRAVVWDRLHGHSQACRICHDYELWLRVLENHRAANLAEVLVDFRIHPGSASRSIGAADIRARENALRGGLAALWPQLSDCEGWPALWSATNFAKSVSGDELRATLDLSERSFQRGLQCTPDALHSQLRRVYAMYLLRLAMRHARAHPAWMSWCIARALRASPTMAVATMAEGVRRGLALRHGAGAERSRVAAGRSLAAGSSTEATHP